MGIQDRDYYREWYREQHGKSSVGSKASTSPVEAPIKPVDADEWWARRIGPKAETVEVNGSFYLPANENGPYVKAAPAKTWHPVLRGLLAAGIGIAVLVAVEMAKRFVR